MNKDTIKLKLEILQKQIQLAEMGEGRIGLDELLDEFQRVSDELAKIQQ